MNKKLAEIFHRDNFQVGDVVEEQEPYIDNGKVKMRNKETHIIGETILLRELTEGIIKRNFTLIQPKGSLEDVLEKMNEKKKLIKYDQKVGLTLCSDEVIYILENWQLKKDGKTLNLWDQSESTQKFIEAILKPKEM